MDKKLANKWIQALRSGKYKQGSLTLKDNEGNYCCLGVLCEIANSGKMSYEFIRKKLKNADTFIEEGFYCAAIPSLNTSLSSLNDSGDGTEPLNFDEIADIIQINYKEL